MMQICGAAASELHSCKPRLDQNENGMLRTFIPAGSGLRSGGARDLCNRESLPTRPPDRPPRGAEVKEVNRVNRVNRL